VIPKDAPSLETWNDLRLAAERFRTRLFAPRQGWVLVYADLARFPEEHLRDFDRRIAEAGAQGFFRWRDRNRGWGEVSAW
jgi:hypothetical protein